MRLNPLKLTKKQRDEVVDRLRAAADSSLSGDSHPWANWFYDLHVFDDMCRVASIAWDQAYDSWSNELLDRTPEWWACIALEAAALVEEGTVP